MYGEKFNLENDDEILKIKSPQKSIQGPFVVVSKNVEERWAIVALCWENEPRLGIRWFWGSNGNPQSRSHATWLLFPTLLQNAILNSLSLNFPFRDRVYNFLAGEISGTDLQKGGIE